VKPEPVTLASYNRRGPPMDQSKRKACAASGERGKKACGQFLLRLIGHISMLTNLPIFPIEF